MVGFIDVFPKDRWVHPGPLGSLGSVLGIVGFVLDRFCLLRCVLWVIGFVRARWVHWGAPWWFSGTSRVAALIGVHPRGHRVGPVSLCSLGCAQVVSEFDRCRWVNWVPPRWS